MEEEIEIKKEPSTQTCWCLLPSGMYKVHREIWCHCEMTSKEFIANNYVGHMQLEWYMPLQVA